MKKEDLIIEAASKVHENWCVQELQGFYTRAKSIYITGEIDLVRILSKACYKGEDKRNEFVINKQHLSQIPAIVNNCFDSFDNFMKLVKADIIVIKRFTSRNLTDQEIKINLKTGDYLNGKENILRNFRELSIESKKENLEAAGSAYTVFEQFTKAGITIDQMLTNQELRNVIGVAIHTDWLKRNSQHAPSHLKVTYEELDDWTKQQDLIVFDALISVVKEKNLVIKKEEGYILPDYLLEEMLILDEIKEKEI